MRGALANVTNARWDAVDADGASDVRAGCVRRSRVVLMSRCWHQAQERRKFLTGDGGKRAVLRGEHEVSRKAIAQGRPGCSACTCMLVCSFVCANRTRDAGAACTRSSLRPPCSGGTKNMQTSGDRRREIIGSRPMFHAAIASQLRIPACRGGRRLPARHTLPADTTLRCSDSNCGYDAPAHPCKSLGQGREQSNVAMSLSKMRMTGQHSNYFFVYAF
jgi:hypothetical protein